MALFALLWPLVGDAYEWHNGLPVDVLARNPAALGAFDCAAGEGWVSVTAPMNVVVHELAHAYDCLDNGLLDGSPGHPLPAWSRDWVYFDMPPYWAAEHYAHEVVRTGRLR